MRMSAILLRIAGAVVLITASAAPVRAQAATSDSATRKVAPAKARTAPVVLRVVNTVKPTKFTGKCPATLHWTAHLTVRNPPVKVQYQWLRSDSAKGPVKEILIHGTEGIIGGESWQLGGDKDQLHVWERLQVLAPNVVHSQAAGANVTCR